MNNKDILKKLAHVNKVQLAVLKKLAEQTSTGSAVLDQALANAQRALISDLTTELSNLGFGNITLQVSFIAEKNDIGKFDIGWRIAMPTPVFNDKRMEQVQTKASQYTAKANAELNSNHQLKDVLGSTNNTPTLTSYQ